MDGKSLQWLVVINLIMTSLILYMLVSGSVSVSLNNAEAFLSGGTIAVDDPNQNRQEASTSSIE